MFFRPRIDFSATNALASSISSSTRLTFSVAFSLRDASFRIHPCSLRPRTFPPPSRERERLSRPKTPSIDRAESVIRTELPTRPLTETNSLLKGFRHRMLSCSFRLRVEQARFRPMTISRFCHRDPSSDVGSSKRRTVLVRLAPLGRVWISAAVVPDRSRRALHATSSIDFCNTIAIRGHPLRLNWFLATCSDRLETWCHGFSKCYFREFRNDERLPSFTP